jgi:hypothetical protein
MRARQVVCCTSPTSDGGFTEIPVGGLGCSYDIMYRWSAAHSFETTNAYRSMRWCFCRPEIADAFATDFGGRRVDMPVDPRRLHIDRPDERELEMRRRRAEFGIEKVTAAR